MGLFNIDVYGVNSRYFDRSNRLKFYKEYIDLMPPEAVLFPKYIKQGKSVLDLGAGAGRTTFHIRKLTDKVYGTDISDAMIKAAKEKYLDINFQVIDACNIDFPDDHFDVVVFSFNGLSLIYPEENRRAAINEINRVLKKNGIFIFSSANRFFPLAPYSMLNLILTKIVMGFSSKYKIHITRHGMLVIYETTPKEETALLGEMGFTLLETAALAEKVTFWGYKPDALTYYAFKKN